MIYAYFIKNLLLNLFIIKSERQLIYRTMFIETSLSLLVNLSNRILVEFGCSSVRPVTFYANWNNVETMLALVIITFRDTANATGESN